VHARGGKILRFCSYGSGIPAPNQEHNPLRYVITWNPRNVVMASEQGAQYLENDKIKIVPWHHVFHHTWPVEVDGVGTLEAYPNRDSIAYMKTFGLQHVRTMIRATLRYPGWSETWEKIVRIGLPNEDLRIPRLRERSYREVVEMFLPMTNVDELVETRLSRFLGISPTGKIMENLTWLGLFSDEEVGCEGETPAAMMIHLLKQKLPLVPGMRDMVVIMHELDVEYGDSRSERITSTLVAEGEANGFTAMAKAVGLPTAVTAKLLMLGELELTGSHIPTQRSIYEPVLREMAGAGLEFVENLQRLE
jgi:saccharopine dehydrogenase-like NADP-dependent oxidoreductase